MEHAAGPTDADEHVVLVLGDGVEQADAHSDFFVHEDGDGAEGLRRVAPGLRDVALVRGVDDGRAAVDVEVLHLGAESEGADGQTRQRLGRGLCVAVGADEVEPRFADANGLDLREDGRFFAFEAGDGHRAGLDDVGAIDRDGRASPRGVGRGELRQCGGWQDRGEHGNDGFAFHVES